MKEVLRLRKGRERGRTRLFVAEGRREVERALAAGLVVRATYVAPELVPDWPHDAEEVSARVLARMAYRTEPEGIVAIVEQPQHQLPNETTLLLVAVGIEKPGNLGAMARTADAAGADALLVAEARADPWNPNAIRASTGAVFTLPIVETTQADLAGLPHRRVAAVLGARRAYSDLDYTAPTAFLVGAEDTGLPRSYRVLAGEDVEIPMRGRTADSLNAGAAAAVLLFEARRQRDAHRDTSGRRNATGPRA